MTQLVSLYELVPNEKVYRRRDEHQSLYKRAHLRLVCFWGAPVHSDHSRLRSWLSVTGTSCGAPRVLLARSNDKS